MVADGFYQWPVKDKPRLISLKDDEPFAFADLWEYWRPKDGDPVKAFTILTTTRNVIMQDVRHRVPLILAGEDWPIWLREANAAADEPGQLCKP